jgi:signal transduction histidine kinase
MATIQKYLIFVLLLVALSASAQQGRIDSLMSEIRQKTDETTKMKLEMAEAKVRQQNLIIGIFVIISLCGASITISLYSSHKRIRRKNLLLNEQYYSIQTQNEKIQAQSEEIAMQAEHLKVANDFLENQNQKLHEINTEREGLISTVAHDLRSPINRSKGLSKILLNTKLTEDQRNIVNLLMQVNEEGTQIILDILQANSTMYEPPALTSIHLHQFINDHIEKVFRDPAKNKNIKIHIAIEDDLQIKTDVVSFRRIIDNLVSNALKFSNLNSEIFIKVMSVEDTIYISIQDQGPGISYEDQLKMFKRFQRLSARPTSGESSIGLGLAIVKGLVEKLGGEIHVKSKVGVGTEFIVRMRKEIKNLYDAPSRGSDKVPSINGKGLVSMFSL